MVGVKVRAKCSFLCAVSSNFCSAWPKMNSSQEKLPSQPFYRMSKEKVFFVGVTLNVKMCKEMEKVIRFHIEFFTLGKK